MTSLEPFVRPRGMRRISAGILAVLGFAVVLAGCGSSIQAGLSNATSTNRQSRPRRQHDAIANGPEACASDAEKQPAFTNPACPAHEQEAAQRGSAQ